MRNHHGRQIKVSEWEPQALDLLRIGEDVKHAMQFKEIEEYFWDNRVLWKDGEKFQKQEL